MACHIRNDIRVETRTTIELLDINAVEFECKKCGANRHHNLSGRPYPKASPAAV